MKSAFYTIFILLLSILGYSNPDNALKNMKYNLYSSVLFENGKRVQNYSSGSNPFNSSAQNFVFDGQASDNLKFIPYGQDNLHLLRLRDIQKKSLQHSNIVSIASSLIGGQIKFKIKDKDGDLSQKDETRIKETKAFYNASNILSTNADRAYNIYAYGYAPVLMNWKVGSTPNSNTFEVGQRDAVDFRLGKHTNSFFGLTCKYHYYHYDWKQVLADGDLQGIKELTPRQYFRQSKIDHKKILKIRKFENGFVKPAKGGMYSHMIGMPKRSNKFYPRPFFESDVFWHKVYGEHELTVVERNGVKNGLRSDHIITVFRRLYDNPEGVSREQIEAQKQIDLRRIQGENVGYFNSGRTQVNFMGITWEGETRETDGNIKIDNIPNNNNFTEISARQASLDRYIRSAHSLTVPEIAGLNDSKTGFSNIAEFLRVGAEVYVDNAIMPHIEQIDKWHNGVVNINNGFADIETFTEPRVIALRALIEQFKEQMTINEVRRDILGKGALSDEEKANLIGNAKANVAEKSTIKSLDTATINNIAIAVQQKLQAA